jgi:hypothetical protein
MIDGPTPWLSQDLRVFKVVKGQPPPAGVDAFAGSTVTDALSYLSTLLTSFNSRPANDSTHPFNSIPSGYDESSLTLLPTVDGTPQGPPSFNFAIAKVRYVAASQPTPDLLRVFFRTFKTQSTSLDFQQGTTYRSGANFAGDTIALLGISPAKELVSIPYYDAGRVDTTAANTPLTKQLEPTSFQLASSAQPTEQWRFFGCLLDFNQPTARFPAQVAGSPDGPWQAGAQSLQDLIRGLHQCLVAEIAYPLDSIPPGANPGSSENLAQRNLAISGSANPGAVESRTVHHTFEVHQTRPPRRGEEGRSSPRLWGDPDELMIAWGDLPGGSIATLYLNPDDAGQVAKLASNSSAVGRVEALGAQTLRLSTDGVTYVPLPKTTRTIPALLTIELPAGVQAGERYGVVVRQISGLSRQVVGTFELSIPVRNAADLLEPEADALAVLRSIEQGLDSHDRWRPVFARYVEQTAGRVRGFGGDPDAIEPSPYGAPHKPKRPSRRSCLIVALLLLVLVALAILLWLLFG